MSKAHHSSRDLKKKPLLTPKEKKQAVLERYFL